LRLVQATDVKSQIKATAPNEVSAFQIHVREQKRRTRNGSKQRPFHARNSLFDQKLLLCVWMVFAVTGIIHFQLSFNFACFRDELRMRRSASCNLLVRTVARRKVGMCLKQQSKGWVEKCLLAC